MDLSKGETFCIFHLSIKNYSFIRIIFYTYFTNTKNGSLKGLKILYASPVYQKSFLYNDNFDTYYKNIKNGSFNV